MSGNSKKTKIAFLFAGQGVLSRDIQAYYLLLKEKDPTKTSKYLKTLQEATNKFNPGNKFESGKILSNLQDKAWNQTSFVQPLIYTLSILTTEFLKQQAEYVMGHSLGALSALTAGRAMDFNRGIEIVISRAKFMQADSGKADKGLCAVIGLEKEKIQQICIKTDSEIALINAPKALVIGADRSKFDQIALEAGKLGALKTIPLSTAGAFHTGAMSDAHARLKQLFVNYPLEQPIIPVVTNMTGRSAIDPAILAKDIIESMIHPVNWARMMSYLKSKSMDLYIEIGPGSSLSSLCRLNGVEQDKITHAKTLLE